MCSHSLGYCMCVYTRRLVVSIKSSSGRKFGLFQRVLIAHRLAISIWSIVNYRYSFRCVPRCFTTMKLSWDCTMVYAVATWLPNEKVSKRAIPQFRAGTCCFAHRSKQPCMNSLWRILQRPFTSNWAVPDLNAFLIIPTCPYIHLNACRSYKIMISSILCIHQTVQARIVGLIYRACKNGAGVNIRSFYYLSCAKHLPQGITSTWRRHYSSWYIVRIR